MRCKRTEDRIMMIRDSKGKNGEFLMSNVSFCVDKKEAKSLVDKKRAFFYTPQKKIVSKEKTYVVDGIFMTRSQMLKLKGKRMY